MGEVKQILGPRTRGGGNLTSDLGILHLRLRARGLDQGVQLPCVQRLLPPRTSAVAIVAVIVIAVTIIRPAVCTQETQSATHYH